MPLTTATSAATTETVARTGQSVLGPGINCSGLRGWILGIKKSNLSPSRLTVAITLIFYVHFSNIVHLTSWLRHSSRVTASLRSWKTAHASNELPGAPSPQFKWASGNWSYSVSVFLSTTKVLRRRGVGVPGDLLPASILRDPRRDGSRGASVQAQLLTP